MYSRKFSQQSLILSGIANPSTLIDTAAESVVTDRVGPAASHCDSLYRGG